MSLFVDRNVVDIESVKSIDEATKLAYNLHEDCLVLKEENTQLKKRSTLYAKTLNEIDDYFEYRHESMKDKKFVVGSLDKLANKLCNSVKDG